MIQSNHTQNWIMAYWNRDEGYTRGGLDVVTAVNLFFKGILLFPIFLLAGYIGVIMMKHMIFQGIPSITAPTQQQQQQIHDRNHQIGIEPKEVKKPEQPIVYYGGPPANEVSIEELTKYEQPQKQTETAQYYPETLPYYSEPHEEPYGRRTLDEALDDYTQEYYYD